MEIAGYLAAFIIGISLGLIGGGGSILTIPLLVYLFHIQPLYLVTKIRINYIKQLPNYWERSILYNHIICHPIKDIDRLYVKEEEV